MPRRLLAFFFLILPLAEIACFIVVGRHIGLLATLSLVVLSAFVGLLLMRMAGFGALARLRQSGREGKAPGKELADVTMIFIAGALLLVPGFLSDIIGLALLMPPVRRFLWNRLVRNVVVVDIGSVPPGQTPRTRSQRTIDLDEEDFHRDAPR